MNRQTKDNRIVLCPRCQRQMLFKDAYCKTCGYLNENNTKRKKQKQRLHFGKYKLTEITTTQKNTDAYKQELTKQNLLLKRISNYIILFIGILCSLMFILPLFSGSNLNTYATSVSSVYNQTQGYNFEINEFFKLLTSLLKSDS